MARKPRTPKYCLHRPTNRGYARFGCARPTYFPGRHGSPESHAAYNRALRLYLDTGSPEPPSSAESTVAVLVDAFKHHVHAHGLYLKNGRPTSERHRLRAAFWALCELFADRLTSSIGLAELDSLRNHMTAKGWAASTVRKYLSSVRSLLRWGEGRGLVPAGLVERITTAERGLGTGRQKRPARAKKKKTAPLDVVGAVGLILGPPFCSMLWLQLLNGIRPGGVCAMRPDRIDTTGDLWRYDEPEDIAAKTGAETHWLGPRAQQILTPYLSHCAPGGFLFRPSVRPRAARSGRITRNYYRLAVARCCADNGLPHFTPNQLRHTHATEVRRLYGLDAARARLGHTKADTTEIYASRDDDLARRVAREIG